LDQGTGILANWREEMGVALEALDKGMRDFVRVVGQEEQNLLNKDDIKATP
jgi:hypothetical protein